MVRHNGEVEKYPVYKERIGSFRFEEETYFLLIHGRDVK